MNSPIDEVRRKARLLENEIDSKLIQLNKIHSTTPQSNGSIGGHHFTSSSISGVEDKHAAFERLSSDLEGLIFKLTKMNNDMKDMLESDKSDPNSKPALYHTVRRHRDILRDYSIEFGRTSTNIRNQLQREELLNTRTSSTGPSCLNNRAKIGDSYVMREGDRINSCDRLLDEQISIAMSVKENVYGQGSHLGGINRRLNQIAKKYPAINSIMQKIRFKKRKDTVILATVITTCLILFFLYAMR